MELEISSFWSQCDKHMQNSHHTTDDKIDVKCRFIVLNHNFWHKSQFFCILMSFIKIASFPKRVLPERLSFPVSITSLGLYSAPLLIFSSGLWLLCSSFNPRMILCWISGPPRGVCLSASSSSPQEAPLSCHRVTGEPLQTEGSAVPFIFNPVSFRLKLSSFSCHRWTSFPLPYVVWMQFKWQ